MGLVLSGRSRTAVWSAAAVLVLGPAVAGCSDDSDDSGGRTGTTSSPAASAPATAPADRAGAQAEIEQNWARFFEPGTSTDDRVKLLEDGERFRALLDGMRSNPLARQTAAKVTAVTFTSPTGATVTWDLLESGTPVLSALKGKAVLQDDVWKLSASSLCALVEMSDAAAPGC
ncbi:hypothetical protein [Streptomyces sp. NPDC093225]|uniref:hypothetical protein n=1 Tax=Streptomyces sp. NPDC093225 TaxID=3366034 RepID=UPI003829B81B